MLMRINLKILKSVVGRKLYINSKILHKKKINSKISKNDFIISKVNAKFQLKI